MTLKSKIKIILNHAKRLKYAQDKYQAYDYFSKEIYEVAREFKEEYDEGIIKLREILEI